MKAYYQQESLRQISSWSNGQSKNWTQLYSLKWKLNRGFMHCSSRQELSTKREAAIPQNCIIDLQHILPQKAMIWSHHTLTAVFSVLPFPAPLLCVYRVDGVYGQAHWASLLQTKLPSLFQSTSNGDCLEEGTGSVSGLLIPLSSFYSSNK